LDEGDIRRLFLSVLEDSQQDSCELRKIFSSIVRSTLKYRDEMLASKGVVVTVEDVRTSLRWLVPALATGTIPDLDNKVSIGLLRIWLSELFCNLSIQAQPRH